MATINSSLFIDNSARVDGGGIFNDSSGTATVRGSTFTSNSAEFGGGIFNNNTIDVTVKDSTFNSNVDSVVGGGAIYGPWMGSGNFFSTTNT
jgi:predicted outer membrane repeat protein